MRSAAPLSVAGRRTAATLSLEDTGGIDGVLELWFGTWATSTHEGDVAPADRVKNGRAWFSKSDDFDDLVRERLGALHGRAAAGQLAAWEETPRGALALTILLDQFPRNCHRGSPLSFAQDGAALSVARRAVARGHHRQVSPVEAVFLLLPFEHAEDMEAQHTAVALLEEVAGGGEGVPEWKGFLEGSVSSAHRHRNVIGRFGRFPHRNAALGRESSPEEAEFLRQPGSSF